MFFLYAKRISRKVNELMAVIPFRPVGKKKLNTAGFVKSENKKKLGAERESLPNKKHRAEFANISKKAAELACNEHLGAKDSLHFAEDLLMGTLGTLYNFLATFSDDQSRRVDMEAIDQDLFSSYIREFPCFWTLEAGSTTAEIMESYLADQLNDSQDLAVEAVLELSSQYGFNFSLADAFSIWTASDRAAFLRVVNQHHQGPQE